MHFFYCAHKSLLPPPCCFLSQLLITGVVHVASVWCRIACFYCDIWTIYPPRPFQQRVHRCPLRTTVTVTFSYSHAHTHYCMHNLSIVLAGEDKSLTSLSAEKPVEARVLWDPIYKHQLLEDSICCNQTVRTFLDRLIYSRCRNINRQEYIIKSLGRHIDLLWSSTPESGNKK